MSHTRLQRPSAGQIQHLQSTASSRNVSGGASTGTGTGRPPPAASAWPVHACRNPAAPAVAPVPAPALPTPQRRPPASRPPLHAAPASQPPSVPRGYEGNVVKTFPAAPQPAENNLSFWLEGLPPDMTHQDLYRLALPRAAFGRVYQVHINEPAYGFDTSAAKLTFFDLDGAANFFDRWCRPSLRGRNDDRALEDLPRWLPAVPGLLRARQVKVTRHRVPVYDIPSFGGPRHSRVLIFVGAVEKVNRRWLTRLFNRLCKSWEMEHWERSAPWMFYGNQHPRRRKRVRKMTVRFGSYRCQAEAIWIFFHSRPIGPDDPEDMRDGVACGFGWDPCCDGRPDPHWGWEMEGVNWVNRRWMNENLLRIQTGPFQATQSTQGNLGARSGPVRTVRLIGSVLGGRPGQIQDTEPTGGSSNSADGAKPCFKSPSSEPEAPKSEGSGSVDIGVNSELAVTSCPPLSNGTTDSVRSDPGPESPPPLTYCVENAKEKPTTQTTMPTRVATVAQGQSSATRSSAALILTPHNAPVDALSSPDIVQHHQKWNSDFKASKSFADFLGRRQQSWREAEQLREACLESP